MSDWLSAQLALTTHLLRFREVQGEHDKAGRLYLRAIEIYEETLGSDHSDLATVFEQPGQIVDIAG